jgi:hypothetical protein
MFERAVQIAVSKADTDVEADALARIIPIARRVDAEERTFAERINRNKAFRGQSSTTQISKRKSAEIDAYAADADEMKASQLLQFEALGSAASVVKCLEMALGHDVKFWAIAHQQAHEADRSIVHAFASVRIDLHSALAAYLAEYYVGED